MLTQKPNYSAAEITLSITEFLSWASIPAGIFAGISIGGTSNSGALGFGVAAVVVAGGLTGVAMAAVGKASLHTSQTAYAILEHLRNDGVAGVAGDAPAPQQPVNGEDGVQPPQPAQAVNAHGWTSKTIRGRKGSVTLTVDEHGFINAPTAFGSKQFTTLEEAVAYYT
jgi:hypothetical protein